jgi:hypothetical protein
MLPLVVMGQLESRGTCGSLVTSAVMIFFTKEIGPKHWILERLYKVWEYGREKTRKKEITCEPSSGLFSSPKN